MPASSLALTAPFDFELPENLEAAEPPEARGLARDEVRLLVSYRDTNRLLHASFRDLPWFLDPGDLIVVNDSETLPAAPATPAKAGDAGRKQPQNPQDLRQVLKQAEDRLRACNRQHQSERSYATQLLLEIDRRGRVASASISDKGLSATPLGRCLVQAVSTLRFRKEDGNAQVKVPIEIRARPVVRSGPAN